MLILLTIVTIQDLLFIDHTHKHSHLPDGALEAAVQRPWDLRQDKNNHVYITISYLHITSPLLHHIPLSHYISTLYSHITPTLHSHAPLSHTTLPHPPPHITPTLHSHVPLSHTTLPHPPLSTLHSPFSHTTLPHRFLSPSPSLSPYPHYTLTSPHTTFTYPSPPLLHPFHTTTHTHSHYTLTPSPLPHPTFHQKQEGDHTHGCDDQGRYKEGQPPWRRGGVSPERGNDGTQDVPD